MLKFAWVVLAFFFSATVASSQCSLQTPPDCDCKYQVEEIEVCFGGTTYWVEVEMCTQYATTKLLDNPCTTGPDSCVAGADAITWIRNICAPQDLKNLGQLAVYNAIIKGTNLCCNNFVQGNIPACQGTSNCSTSTTAYCHLLMLPKCSSKNFITGCYDYCNNGCNDFCVVERRYCGSGVNDCCMHARIICDWSDDVCEIGCTTPFDQCDQLVASSQSCCR